MMSCIKKKKKKSGLCYHQHKKSKRHGVWKLKPPLQVTLALGKHVLFKPHRSTCCPLRPVTAHLWVGQRRGPLLLGDLL